MYINPNKQKDKQTASPKKYPQGYFNSKNCRMCGVEFNPVAPSELYCSDVCKDLSHNDKYLRRIYGISIDEYRDLLLRSNGVCEICGDKGFILNPKSKAKLVVDHDHSTNKVRGMLCHNCNRALGLLKDSIDTLKSAIVYLERATTISKESTHKRVEAQGKKCFICGGNHNGLPCPQSNFTC